MKETREQKRARLLAVAAAAIDELLVWEETNKAPNLRQIEEEVLKLRAGFGQELALTVLEGQEAVQPTAGVKCPQCGQEMRYKGRKPKEIESWVVDGALKRGYYYCPACKQGIFPLDEQLELGAGVWSESLEQELVWLSAAVGSFELAETIMQRIGRKNVSCSSIWRCTQAAGERFRALEARERQLANGLPELWDPPSRAEVADQRKGVALDGALIYIRDEQWKELKIGDVFDVAVQPTPDPETGEVVDLAHAVNNRYVAHLGGPEVLGELLWAEARGCGWEQAQDTIVLGDGAVWIWNQAALHFGRSHQLVDWYHARQHLVEAARLLKAEGTSSHRRWLNSRTTLLYQGHAARIADELDKAARKQPATTAKSSQTTQAAAPAKQEALAREATYFRTNHLRMNYLEMREEEWPIGSGVIESGAKQFKARFTGPGMRWSRQGAENLIPLRAAVLSNHFDASWTAAKNLPPA